MRPAIALSLGLLIGLALGIALGRGALAPGGGEGAVVAVLEAELERERAIGEALRDRVEDLETRVAEAPPSDGAAGVADRLEEPGDAIASSADADDGGEPADADSEQGASDPTGGFDEERLLELGFHPSDVERLRRAWESLELQRLYLQDERARSSKRDGRYWLEMRALENETLEELGASEYDALLYASGSRNRITVTRVFPDSPAEEAGFVEGDQITEYDDRPLYRMHVLKRETTRCELGSTLAVTVLRDGAERRIWTQCGPLGIQLEMVNAPPR